MPFKANPESGQPAYLTLDSMLAQISGANGEACRQILEDNQDLFKSAAGASHNHQTWPGGYYDHVTDAMNIVSTLYDSLNSARPLPFGKSDALLVIFLHDLEKPFKYKFDSKGNLISNIEIADKASGAAKRLEVISQYGIVLNEQQANALKFVEGIRDEDYKKDARVMGELAALCHSADTLSARMWYNYPSPEGKDSWEGATRVNPLAANFVLKSEIES